MNSFIEAIGFVRAYILLGNGTQEPSIDLKVWNVRCNLSVHGNLHGRITKSAQKNACQKLASFLLIENREEPCDKTSNRRNDFIAFNVPSKKAEN